MKKLDTNGCSFAHLTLILLLHYLVICRSRSLVVYNNEFLVDREEGLATRPNSQKALLVSVSGFVAVPL